MTHPYRFSSSLARVLLATVALACGACGTYQPRSGSYAEVRGTFVRKGLTHWDQLELIGVDGQSLGMPLYGQQYRKVDAGSRDIHFAYTGNRGFFGRLLKAPIGKVNATLVANRKYELAGEFDLNRGKVWVRDAVNKKPASTPVYGAVNLAPINSTYTPVIVPVVVR